MALVYPAPLPILAYLATGSSGGPLCSGRVAHFASGTLAQFGPENALFFLLFQICLEGEDKAIALSDITKAPFVTLIALCGDLRISGIKRPL